MLGQGHFQASSAPGGAPSRVDIVSGLVPCREQLEAGFILPDQGANIREPDLFDMRSQREPKHSLQIVDSPPGLGLANTEQHRPDRGAIIRGADVMLAAVCIFSRGVERLSIRRRPAVIGA